MKIFIAQIKYPFLREFSIILIKNYLTDIKKIIFINYLKDNPNKNDKVYFEKVDFVELIRFNTSNKTVFDFKTYILKHLDHNKISKFNGFLDALNKIDNKTAIVKDYIALILQYEKECEGKTSQVVYKNILLSLRDIILENKDLWVDFENEDINYFLNYCNKNNSKKI